MELRCGHCLGLIYHAQDGLRCVRCQRAWLVTKPAQEPEDDLLAPGTPYFSELIREMEGSHEPRRLTAHTA